MPTTPAPDTKPWEPKLESAPEFNPFMNPANPDRSLEEEAADAKTAAGLDESDDEPTAPTGDSAPSSAPDTRTP